jgi:hypothetical protein
MRLDLARAVGDTVLYDGYLLYPYRPGTSDDQSRWQVGVLGPACAEDAGFGESSTMSMQCLLTSFTRLVVHLRFLQLQHRVVHSSGRAPARHRSSATNGQSRLTWDEAVERELIFELSPFDLEAGGTVVSVTAEGGEEVQPLGQGEGRVVRRRWPLTAEMRAATVPSHGCTRLDVTLLNLHAGSTDAVDAKRHSLIGTHVIIEAPDAEFVSLIEPPDALAEAAAACSQHRFWPVLGGEAGDTDLLLGLPVVLGDYPEIDDEVESAEPTWPAPADIRDVEPPPSEADATSRR